MAVPEEVKKRYNAKVQKGSNAAEDDIELVESEKAETWALARLKAESKDGSWLSIAMMIFFDSGLFVCPPSQ